jgi:hypothetical protein
MTDMGIRAGLQGMAGNAFPAPGQEGAQSRSVSPSLSSSGAQPTEPKAVPANDPTMTISPRQVAAANAPQPPPQQAQLPAPPPVPPYVPRPVQTVPIAPQQAAQQIPLPPPRPPMPQAPIQQAQPQVNPIANPQPPVPQPPVPQPPIPQPAIGAITPEIEAGLHASGLVPEGRSVADHVALLSRYGQLAQSTGVRDAGKVYLDRLDQIAKAIGDYRGAGLKERQSVIEPAVKMAIDRLGESQKKTDAIADGITVSHDLMAQLDSKSGIFSGQWATQKLWMAKVAQALNITGVDPRTTNTEAFSALVGKKVAQTVKSFGSGTSITNQDREYAAKMEAGDIKLDETSMRRILQITDKINRGIIDKHNQQVDALVRSRPELANMAQTMKVDTPPAYGGGPPVPGARRGDDNQWYIADPNRPGKFLRVKS